MFRQRTEASISVFLALTITLILSFCMVLIESARENTLLLKASIAMDAGIQSILAEYHVPLWEEYDLLYVDCSYNTSAPSYELVKEHLEEYVDKNLAFGNRGWLGIDYESADISEVLLATDFGGRDFYLQAVRSAEASVAIPYIQQVMQWFEKIEATYSVGDVFQKKVFEATSKMEEVNGTEIKVKEAVWGTDTEGKPILLEEDEYEVVDIENPLEQILSANLLLRQVVSDYSKVSKVNVSLEELVSHRNLAVGTAVDEREEDTLWNKILFCKYVMDHFDCYGDELQEDASGLRYELEYVIGGKASDHQNMEVVVAELLLIREIDNYLLLLQDEVRKMEAHQIAMAASAALVPWMEPVIYQAVLLYWAYEDSVQDLEALLRGGEIPLVKSLSLEAIDEFILGYEEYLLLLLLMQKQENLAMRSMDVIELSLRETHANFQMDACIGQALLTGLFYDIYDKKYMVSGEIRYD